MSQKTILLAHSNWRAGSHLTQQMASCRGFNVIGLASDLTETFAMVEDYLPNAVLVSSDLAQRPEFEVMRALFDALDVRWMQIETDARVGPQRTLAKSGLFSLPASTGTEELASQIMALTRGTHAPQHLAQGSSTGAPFRRIILIGASTGGIDALLTVLRHYPQDCPPTIIVQHTGKGFGQSLARLLDDQCAAKVRLAEHPSPLKRGEIILGAGIKKHLVLTPDRPVQAVLEEGAPVLGHQPSVDALFQSALPMASRAVAALLTGMGRDGAAGLTLLRQAGAITIAQDEATSIVYGMPRVAMEMGGADMCLPIDEIGATLLREAQVPSSAIAGRQA